MLASPCSFVQLGAHPCLQGCAKSCSKHHHSDFTNSPRIDNMAEHISSYFHR
ncbi:Protein of unknown function [Pyronema omphalodes CBS 100304]|uniref:Uncharacterized protein n=1 Tax=Pyronema omphalodes (strain CBS 100304) TaxID=1076935 RepID=U4L390_PYROM|nr:Protein of unknown function [Pyronema omphalodes CBS 100304]